MTLRRRLPAALMVGAPAAALAAWSARLIAKNSPELHSVAPESRSPALFALQNGVTKDAAHTRRRVFKALAPAL
ncbi:hypothetical protein [Kocuria sp. ZOR0020]|uniref:hypothetical protein n=1 Tax=Kocuria sp. ZOR0020 TaxID=1339234 RepID=UPI000A9B975D|nr:hypothetical protein [Kocuria sp. ZOR0020]